MQRAIREREESALAAAALAADDHAGEDAEQETAPPRKPNAFAMVRAFCGSGLCRRDERTCAWCMRPPRAESDFV